MGDGREPPWSGECLVVPTRRGRTVLLACRTASTAGAAVAFALARPARRGLRVGLSVTTVVRSTETPLRWSADADERVLRWEERGIVLRGRFTRTSLPVTLALPILDRGDVAAVPARLAGRWRPGTVEVEVPEGDELAALRGRHRGVVIGGPGAVTDWGRPVRVLQSLRPTRRVAEPGLPCQVALAEAVSSQPRQRRAPVG